MLATGFSAGTGLSAAAATVVLTTRDPGEERVGESVSET
jgi:hypothetical protein